nr:MAG TPA: hypothetical protein [Caudoviricetes sp.]
MSAAPDFWRYFMSCKPVCRLCDNLVLSQAVTFTDVCRP